jgi:hypothetical protein
MLKKPRFILFFIFIIIKTALKMSIIKITLKDLRKIRFMTVFVFILITTVSAFKVFIIKTVSEKCFD